MAERAKPALLEFDVSATMDALRKARESAGRFATAMAAQSDAHALAQATWEPHDWNAI